MKKKRFSDDSLRLENYDYSQKGAYFITIATKNRNPFFGKIIDKEMSLSKIGRFIWDEWFKTPVIRPDMNIILDEFVIMPDHIHGIIYIGDNQYNSLQRPNKNEFGPQRKNLSAIIRGFKSATTKKSREINPNFGWQSRFFDRIIRDKYELFRIQKYIIENPEKW